MTAHVLGRVHRPVQTLDDTFIFAVPRKAKKQASLSPRSDHRKGLKQFVLGSILSFSFKFVFSKTRLAHTVGALFVFCSRSRHRSAALYSSGLCSSAEDQQLESV